ncbi:uncharacterized protein LOC141632891 [Silene latifolia]|uniref:uncharacterized protein LOC141632891 n=1 Tax=Silene latifolia TaxID=37657 RepID=UPI003D7842ED
MRTDRSWMHLPRRLPEYENGVIEFLNASFSKVVVGGQIRCPCKRCKNRYWLRRDEVFDHLKAFGFVENYDEWIFHGEEPLQTQPFIEKLDEGVSFMDNTDELLNDTFRNGFEGSTGVEDGLNDEAIKFYKLVEDGKQELYPGCKRFSKLSFLIRLLLFKTLHGISNVAFNDLLELLKEMVPEAKIPLNYTESRNIVKDLGLHYIKIYACPNDCMLFWKENEQADECLECHTSKWKPCEENQSQKKTRKIPAKVLWYFPLKPRLQRVYMCSKTAEFMTWHADERPKDGYLRHPADGLAWQKFDSLYPSFASEPRNVRLGLASDGFNPFRTMSVAHSTWPVVLINYNLPPWMFMKPEYFMLSLLIPGPEGPVITSTYTATPG